MNYQIFSQGDIVFAPCNGFKPYPGIITKIFIQDGTCNVKFISYRSSARVFLDTLELFNEQTVKKYEELYYKTQDSQQLAIIRTIKKTIPLYAKKNKKDEFKSTYQSIPHYYNRKQTQVQSASKKKKSPKKHSLKKQQTVYNELSSNKQQKSQSNNTSKKYKSDLSYYQSNKFSSQEKKSRSLHSQQNIARNNKLQARAQLNRQKEDIKFNSTVSKNISKKYIRNLSKKIESNRIDKTFSSHRQQTPLKYYNSNIKNDISTKKNKKGEHHEQGNEKSEKKQIFQRFRSQQKHLQSVNLIRNKDKGKERIINEVNIKGQRKQKDIEKHQKFRQDKKSFKLKKIKKIQNNNKGKKTSKKDDLIEEIIKIQPKEEYFQIETRKTTRLFNENVHQFNNQLQYSQKNQQNQFKIKGKHPKNTVAGGRIIQQESEIKQEFIFTKQKQNDNMKIKTIRKKKNKNKEKKKKRDLRRKMTAQFNKKDEEIEQIKKENQEVKCQQPQQSFEKEEQISDYNIENGYEFNIQYLSFNDIQTEPLQNNIKKTLRSRSKNFQEDSDDSFMQPNKDLNVAYFYKVQDLDCSYDQLSIEEGNYNKLFSTMPYRLSMLEINSSQNIIERFVNYLNLLTNFLRQRNGKKLNKKCPLTMKMKQICLSTLQCRKIRHQHLIQQDLLFKIFQFIIAYENCIFQSLKSKCKIEYRQLRSFLNSQSLKFIQLSDPQRQKMKDQQIYSDMFNFYNQRVIK